MRHTVFLVTAIMIASLFGSSAFATVVNVRGAPSCSIWLKGQEAERQMQGFNTGQDWLIGYLVWRLVAALIFGAKTDSITRKYSIGSITTAA